MPIAAAIPYVTAAATVAGTVSTISSQRKLAKTAQSAVSEGRGLVGNLTYQPINIEKIKADATAQAVQNATQSLALERALQPEVADTRAELARQVGAELQQRGNLPADIANKVAMEARTIGGRSGTQGNVAPVTASLIGLTSLDLLRDRQRAASNLLAANPLQPAGLDPGSLASLEVAENAAQNQFNLEKSGVTSNLINAQAKADAAKIGADASIVPSVASGLTAMMSLFKPRAKSGYETLLNKTTPTFNYTLPKLNYSLLGGAAAAPVT